jgi:peptide deformylase
MALLPVLRFPDPRLRQKAEPVQVITPEISELIDNMLETMYEENGVGLAAIQVNVKKQIIVIDVSDEANDPRVLINPEILWKKDFEKMSEGCLSVPGIYAEVERAKHIEVRALDRTGQMRQFEAQGLFAHCIQHEIDHLQGKLFVDYLSALKRDQIRKQLEKARKQTL